MDRGPELDQVWQEFHDLANMTSRELNEFLSTDASGEEGMQAPDALGRPLGEQVANILAKRKVDLSDDDVDTMRTVVEQVRAVYPEGDVERVIDVSDGALRHQLMSLGHDPLKVK